MIMLNSPETAPIWLIGSGEIARAYADVLHSLEVSFVAIGRNPEKTIDFASQYGADFFHGGLKAAIKSEVRPPEFAIVATDIANLSDCVEHLVEFGVSNILVEKPFSLELNIAQEFVSGGSNIFVAFNRRFFASVTELKRRIKVEGGLRQIHFEISERIKDYQSPSQAVLTRKKWGVANSLHVIDLAQMLTGGMNLIGNACAGRTSSGHKSLFAGSGECAHSTGLVTYSGNWEGVGRWGISVDTVSHRYELLPLEELYVLSGDFLSRERIECVDSGPFKHGFKEQVLAFLFNQEDSSLCTFSDFKKTLRLTYQIFGYEAQT